MGQEVPTPKEEKSQPSEDCIKGAMSSLQVVDSVPGRMEFMMRVMDSLKTTMMDGKRLKSEKASWMVCPLLP